MSLLSLLFGRPRSSASVAKQRLQRVLAADSPSRAGRGDRKPDYLPALQRELFGVVARHAKVQPRDVRLRFEHERGSEVIRVKIELRRHGRA